MPVPKPIRVIGLVLLMIAPLLVFVHPGVHAQTPDQGQIEQGASLYAQNCAVCHGPHGEGRIGATLDKNWPSIRPDLTVKTIITNGVPGSVMPAWGQQNGGPMSANEIDALVAYILSWQTGSISNIPTPAPSTPRPPITPVAQVVGDPNRGAALFDENCVVCHGRNGEGRIGATLAKSWASVRPDLTIKTTIQNGVPGSLMPAWAQQNGGPLTDENINDLVAFVLSIPHNTVIQVTPEEQPSPSPIPWLSGWGGVVLFFVLFVVIVAVALIVQRRA
jgi:cytochrome c oxidase cbb3-type subunit 3